METILLAWNPGKFPWGDLQDELARVRIKGRASDAWSVGNSRHPQPGDRFFMIRLGEEPKGIVGSGWITSRAYEGRHWDLNRDTAGQSTLYVNIIFDRLESEPLIAWDRLQQPPFASFRWGIQMSGVRIPADTAAALEAEWERVTSGSTGHPEEFAIRPRDYREGELRRVYVNAYERNLAARARCIARYGFQCAACGMRFLERYGNVAEHLIHVHHLRPLSDIRREYDLDPIRDLRPVCPNCHAVIHLRNPPYTIEEVQQLLAETAASTSHLE